MSNRPMFSKPTRLKMAACAALGLEFWSGHPADGCVWAVDDKQRTHVVRIRYAERTACLQRAEQTRIGVKYFDVGERVAFDLETDAPRVVLSPGGGA